MSHKSKPTHLESPSDILSQVMEEFKFLHSEYGFRNCGVEAMRRGAFARFRRSDLDIVLEFEFGEVFDICIETTGPENVPKQTEQLSSLMRKVCPAESGWPSARNLPDSWPLSSDLTSSKNLRSLCQNFARVLKMHFGQLLDGSMTLKNLLTET